MSDSAVDIHCEPPHVAASARAAAAVCEVRCTRAPSVSFSSARRLGIAALALLATLAPAPAHALKVTTWNLLQYPGLNLAGRQPLFRTVMKNLDTDIILVQELGTAAGADSFLYNVLRVANPTKGWKDSGYLSATESTIYYDSTKVSVSFQSAIPTGGPRQAYLLLVTPKGYTSQQAKFRIYSIHFKAGNPAFTPADSMTRRLECSSLRNTLNSAAAGTNILMGGDTNFYGDWEGGYQRLTESQLDNDGRLKDLLSMPGTWNQFAYRCYHTQSPCLSCPSMEYSGGGLDDRFDLFLASYPMADGQKTEFLGASAYGNDCNHYNEDVNFDGRNSAVPIEVANALHDASDHLPVVATIQLPAKIVAASQLDFGAAITGGVATRNLTVTNGATLLPADGLTYSMTAPAGFTAPAGTFEAAAGAAGNVHVIGMDTTTPGTLSGTLVVASDDVDSLNKNVLLSGTVLAHASASLDSLTPQTAASVTFGNHGVGGFTDLPVRVHNRGWNALQARLSVANAVITGGGGKFSIVGGFTPSLVSGVARTLSIHFDDAGATLDQDYQATLTISSTDEPLPGAAGQPDLVVSLHAHPSSGTAGVEHVIPKAFAFLPPRPSPFTQFTALRFDLPRTSSVSLAIYDAAGRRVRSLVSGVREAGQHEVRWNGTDDHDASLGAGLYFARFVTPGWSATRRIVILP